LQGRHKGTHRVRVGDWRILCQIDDAARTVVVLRIGNRGDVY
jgi:mRNA interferase RelE/StbE